MKSIYRMLGLGALMAVLTAGPAAAETTLQLWMTGVGLDKFMNKVVPEFERANPTIKVETTNLSWSSYQEKILTGVSAGAGPDVMSFYSVDTAPWAARGVLADLTENIDANAFIPNALANGRWNGQIYALPIGLRMRPLYYRTDFLKEAGFRGPPQTWPEMRDYAKKLVKKDSGGNIERVGFWVPTNHPYKTVQVWLTFLWNAGGDVFSEDGKKAIFNSPAGVEATEYLASFLNKDKVDAPGTIKIDNVDFAQGRVAMLVSNIVTRDLLKNYKDLKDDVGIAMVPKDKSQYIELSGDMLGVAANSQHKQAAMALLNFIAAKPEIAQKYYEIDRTIPSLKALANSEYVKSDPWIPTYLSFMDHARPLPANPHWTEISAVITKALDSAYLDGVPAKKALDDAANEANQILSR